MNPTKMVKCKKCGKVYPNQLSNCPDCFTKNKNYTATVVCAAVIVFLVVFIFSFLMIEFVLNDNQNSLIQGTEYDIISSEGSISLNEFNAIETGMTYKQVCEIIGGEGTLVSSVDMDIGDEYKTELYEWTGDGIIGANANITFQNNKVVSKAQYGLK